MKQLTENGTIFALPGKEIILDTGLDTRGIIFSEIQRGRFYEVEEINIDNDSVKLVSEADGEIGDRCTVSLQHLLEIISEGRVGIVSEGTK